jgi:hypothetical protein
MSSTVRGSTQSAICCCSKIMVRQHTGLEANRASMVMVEASVQISAMEAGGFQACRLVVWDVLNPAEECAVIHRGCTDHASCMPRSGMYEQRSQESPIELSWRQESWGGHALEHVL